CARLIIRAARARLAAVAAAVTPAATTAAAAAATALRLARLVHHDRAPAEAGAVERLDRRLRVSGVSQLHECKAARPPRLPVGDDLHLRHLLPFLSVAEEAPQCRLVGAVRKVSHVKPGPHDALSPFPVR